MLSRGKIVGVVGGDHSVSFGAIEAHAARFPGMGLLHVDAHADLRRAYQGFTWSHASVLENVASRLSDVSRIVQVGIREVSEEEVERIAASKGRIRTFYDGGLAQARFDGETWSEQVERIVAELGREVYVTFDVDGLDPALCPHTGTKVPGGLSFQMATTLIGAVVRSGRRIVGFDLTEVVPAGDGTEWDENVAARLLYKLIGWNIKSLPLP
jgi:agmatinase